MFEVCRLRGEQRANLCEIPAISLGAPGFGSHLDIERGLGYTPVPRTTEAHCHSGRGNDKSRKD